MEWAIIRRFSGKESLGFTLQDLIREFPDRNPASLGRILSKMVEKGILMRITRGVYHIVPVKDASDTYVPKGHQVAEYIMKGRAYYIAFASAMQIHGLSRQEETREYVVTKNETKFAAQDYGGVPFQFIRLNDIRFFGFSSRWINQCEKAMVSDLEKTIVDMAAKPQYCGGVFEVAFALYHSNDRIDLSKLLYYFGRYNHKGAIKRYLFLSDLLNLIWTEDHKHMLTELGSTTTLLDPSLPDKGRRIKKFGLRINVDPDSIRKRVLT